MGLQAWCGCSVQKNVQDLGFSLTAQGTRHSSTMHSNHLLFNQMINQRMVAMSPIFSVAVLSACIIFTIHTGVPEINHKGSYLQGIFSVPDMHYHMESLTSSLGGKNYYYLCFLPENTEV